MGSILCSNFSEIFDVDWFISYLSKDVKIVKELPAISGRIVQPYRTRVPRKCNQGCYQSRMVPLLDKKKVHFESLSSIFVFVLEILILACFVAGCYAYEI